MSIRDPFSNSIAFVGINEYAKGAVKQISARLGHVYHVPCCLSYIVPKYIKFKLSFKNAVKN